MSLKKYKVTYFDTVCYTTREIVAVSSTEEELINYLDKKVNINYRCRDKKEIYVEFLGELIIPFIISDKLDE